ncbi:MAG: elongation factor G [Desulfovibrio sp.]|nr:elongation factor G [Desulfovibrio sp.]
MPKGGTTRPASPHAPDTPALKAIRAIRNLGIIAHIDAGKTTLTERMLFYSRKIHRMGEVHDGSATMDFMPEEQERGITIASACTTCQWQRATLNIIDTPGHVDFTIEVERSLRVLDGAVGVFCAVGGVEPQSETVWRQSEQFGVPKIAFVNKMDRPGADFAAVLEAMRGHLKANAVAVTAPLGQGDAFAGVLDLIDRETLTFSTEDQGSTVARAPWAPEEEALGAPWREQLLERLAEADDTFLELWLEGAPTEADIRAALRRATLARTVVPVFCGSALRNTGVQPLLDGVRDYLPSPLDVPPPFGLTPDGGEVRIEPDPAAPLAALVFKVVVENGRKLAFARVYAGAVREGETVRVLGLSPEGAPREQAERVGRIFRLHADRREQLEAVGTGDIAALVGLRSARTGDTCCGRGRDVRLEAIAVQPPVITLALEPRNADEGKTLDEALARYAEEDPTLAVSLDEDSGLRMVSGMGELHLDVLLERMRREYGIGPRAGQPQAVLRETVSREGGAQVVFDREFGKERQQGDVSVSVAPRARDAGNLVRVGDFLPADEREARKLLPQAYLEAALEGVRDGLQSGVATGWPVVDVEVVLTGVARTEGLTTLPGCRMAAAQALREALTEARPLTLEPIMKTEITVPEEFLGAAIGLFTTASGKVEDVEDQAGRKLLRGRAPLRRLFGFSTALRSATQGRAGLTLSFDRFDAP